MFGEKKLYSAVLHKKCFSKHFSKHWKLFKLGSVSVRDIRKNVHILQVGGASLVSPTPPLLRLVLLHKKAFV